MSDQQDIWAAWLNHRRQGGATLSEAQVSQLRAVRERVLHGAALRPGMTLLDVGCGDGLIGFGAVERLGPTGCVIFSDISEDLLAQCADQARLLGCEDRCSFVQASADNLTGISADSVDAVTTRAVLTYVQDRPRALAEFARVVHPGGRVSLHEPINRRWQWPGFQGYQPMDVDDLLAKVLAAAADITSGEEVMTSFDESDLLAAAQAAGFMPAGVELLLEVRPVEAQAWEPFYHSSPNPFAPTVEELLQRALGTDDRMRFCSALKSAVEGGEGWYRYAAAYLWATKPL